MKTLTRRNRYAGRNEIQIAADLDFRALQQTDFMRRDNTNDDHE